MQQTAVHGSEQCTRLGPRHIQWQRVVTPDLGLRPSSGAAARGQGGRRQGTRSGRCCSGNLVWDDGSEGGTPTGAVGEPESLGQPGSDSESAAGRQQARSSVGRTWCHCMMIPAVTMTGMMARQARHGVPSPPAGATT